MSDPISWPLFSVSIMPEHSVELHLVPGGAFPVKLSLTMKNHQSLSQLNEIYPEAAGLDIHMSQETVMALFTEIQAVARKMDWPLPK